MSFTINKNPSDKKSSTESQVFKNAIGDRPLESDLSVYERVPIEDFGLSLLKGMGWKEGQGIGKNG
jgi:hypothetical protein